MKRRTSAFVAGAIALALGLSACATGDPDDGATSTGTTEPTTATSSADTGAESSFTNTNAHPYADLKDGGTLNLTIGEFTEQKNQFNADGTTDTWLLWDFYNAELIKFKPNGDLNFNPNYLEDVTDEVVDGNTVVTYVVNPEAKFNDGTPMDIVAFQNTWKSTNGSNADYNPNSTDGWNKIASVEQGADAFEIVVTFNGPWPWWGGVFNTLLHPACNTAECFNTAYLGTDMASAHPEWGAGPYKLDSFDAAVGTAVLVPNENWWGTPAKLDQITLSQREQQAEINAFKNGEVDALDIFTSADALNQAKDVPGTELRSGAMVATYMLQLNSKSPNLSDPAVREAVMTAIDRKLITDVRFQGLDYTEEFPGSLLLFTYQEGYQDNFSQVIPAADPDASKALLEGVGYVMGDDGYYAKDGATLELGYTMFSDSPANVSQAQVIQSQLKDVGIKMNVVQKAASDFSDVMSSGDWEMNVSGFASSDPFGVAYTCQIWCSEADDNYSGLNKSGVGNADLDAEIHDMEALPTAEEQIAAANEIEVKLLGEFGLMPLFNGPAMSYVKTDIANMGSGVFAGKSSFKADFAENLGYV